jgi:PEP-CTERM motif
MFQTYIPKRLSLGVALVGIRTRFLNVSLVGIATLLIVAQAHAAPIGAVSFTGGTSPGDPDADGVTDGWQFSITTFLTITDLGFYDVGGDGFAESHPVGIWTDGGTLLASVTVTPADALEADLFRYASVAPILLSPGTYRVGGFRTIADGSITSATGFATASEITFLDAAFEIPSGGTLMFPSILGGATPGIFGGSFKFEPAETPIPEPSTWLLLGTGLAARLGYTWRKKKQRP